MTCEELFEALNAGEDSSNQFKVTFKNIDQLAAEIAAFANTDGGRLIIGVTDAGELNGLSKDEVGRLNQWLSNVTSQKIEPPVFVKTEILLCKKKRILIVQVPRGGNKPYAVNKTAFWVKNGADKRRATREELFRLMQSSRLLFADELETETTLEDLDQDRFKKFYENHYAEKLETAASPNLEKMLENLKLLANDRLTLAGLLLFGQNPELTKPQFSIVATSYVGKERGANEYLDSEKIQGVLSEQFREAVGFVKRNLHKIQAGRNFNAPGIIEIPLDSFSEAIGNAIVHRDYFINAPVFVEIFEDRVEVISPGSLPNTLTEENIRYGVHIERNPTILSFLEKDPAFRYSGRGSGIPRMIKACRKMNVRLDLINDRDKQQFRVAFYRNPIKPGTN